ncbi:MAG TPA: hypothetical protein VG225_11045 [Terracidiphilus sp.]|jgi:hypothetical protein|nr:hypothetical protein [Terracidiphilus sp.]
MSDANQNLAVTATQTARAVARLASNDATFRATVDAFRAGDGDSFTRLLTEAKALGFCEEICRWFASKECVLLCLELCGPPSVDLGPEQVAAATAEIIRLSQDEELVEQLANLVERRDASGWKAFVAKQKLGPFCHLICSWVCTIRYRLICEVVCQPYDVPERELADQLALAGKALSEIANKGDQLQQIINAAIALNCEYLQGVVGGFNDCIWICVWICSWRSVLFCGPICRPIEIPRDAIDEMRAFGQLTGKLANMQGAYGLLFDAINARDQKAFSGLVDKFEIGVYCVQLCRWLSYEVCNRFCQCICPEPETIPLFTKVGIYSVAPVFGDFQPNGTTTAGGYAFSTQVNLNGILPDGTASTAMQYRFTYLNLAVGGTPTPMTGATVPPSIIGQLEYLYWDSGLTLWLPGWADFYANLNPADPRATVDIPQFGGGTLTVNVYTNPDADGWISVPRMNDLTPGGVGRFLRNTGVMVQLDTTQLTNESFDLTAAGPGLPVLAGMPVPAAQESVKPLFKINFEARNAVTLAAISGNSLDVIALSNTAYKYTRHPDWAGGVVTTIPVVSLDIVEMQAGGCQPLGSTGNNTLHLLYTAYHPYIGSVSLQFVGPAPLPTVPVPAIPADGDVVSGAAGVSVDISMLIPCAYVVFLNVNLNLTNGDVVLGGTYQDFVAFCRR